MAQNTKYHMGVLDEHYTFWYESNCGNCKYLIDGLTSFTCSKHTDKIPANFWNNDKSCLDRKEVSEHRPYIE